LAGLHALVVDDNAVSRLVLVDTLQNWGFVVDQAATPGEALDLFATAEACGAGYAVALVDYQMPEMNGVQLARTLRCRHPRAATTLVLLSSARDVSPREARDAGFASVLTKPVRNADLLGRIMNPLVCQHNPEPVGADN
jgi:CheY-like chemotaxis protein